MFQEVMEVSKTMNDFFTVHELARHFGVNPKTIYRRLWAKGIAAYKVGSAWRIAKKDIVWLRG
jgi:excisionase family DNA binding protein